MHAQGWSQRRIAHALGVSQAAVIKEEFGVAYSRAHISRLLKTLNWTPPRPLERASQRDEAAIAAWRAERWPELEKGTCQWLARSVQRRERLLPAARLRRTYAPAGQTPLLHTPCRYEHLSVMAAVTTKGQLLARVRDRSLRSEDSGAFLRPRRGHLAGGKMLVVWTGSPTHRHEAMRAFRLGAAAAQPFVFEARPGYVPDLDPLDSGLWHHLKDVALANVCCHDLQELRESLTAALLGLRRKPHLIQAAFANAKLGLE